ncbi:hypothetical protein E0198_004794 [Clavispora lusitaniae]|nr:hypothetical protein E0198_004794 [Clavispora lusitaniae]
MSLRFVRSFSARTRVLGVWSDFSARPASLKLANEKLKTDLFQGIGESGPHSVVDDKVRAGYHSPLHIDDVFKSAYTILEKDAEKVYEKVAGQKGKMSLEEEEELLVQAEQANPEVLHQVEFDLRNVDRTQPVFRRFLQKKWESYALMVTMQRLEQLHVIPDTLPTLEPKVDVRVKFPHNTKREFSGWVEPGTVLPAFAVARPPTVEVQEFFRPADASGLYTVVLVNPDTPDLASNSFSTTLQYGLCNVPLDYANNTIGAAQLLANPGCVFEQYEPLVPEKNAPVQRACLWVFRQQGQISPSAEKSNFDIRAFAAEHGLTAVGAHVWRQHFDRSVAKVRTEYGLPRGNVYHRVRGTKPLV